VRSGLKSPRSGGFNEFFLRNEIVGSIVSVELSGRILFFKSAKISESRWSK
jgi:hypothetical protein